MLKLLILTILIGFPIVIHAQWKDLSNLKSKKIALISNSRVELDSLTIVPNSIFFRESETTQIDYSVENNILIINSVKNPIDSILVEFRVLPINIEKKYSLLDSSQLTKKDKAIYIGYDYSPDPTLEEDQIIAHKGLDYDGSFSRGLSVGNAQSLLLNSNFNLQLAGDLGNDINIRAAISDDNIPIQAEGNTQLLQEFDKVFIEVSRKNNRVIAGDFEVRKPNSYFINYFKKLQGLGFENRTTFDPDHHLSTKANFAVAKGKFARVTLNTTEGNQGPYKLQGLNGELFIIVLSGSERIYLDGQELTRGQDNDYVINYDRSEITFTPKVLINKDIRIIVEYEYSERNYLRSLYTIESAYHRKNLDVRFNFFSQQDSKTTTGQIELNPEDVSILQNSGDDPSQAVRTGFRQIADDVITNENLYTLRENPLDPELDSILVFSTEESDIRYSARFTEVGLGNGDYIIDDMAFANGRVYKYVGPSEGNFLPIIQLIAPEQSQMISVAADYKFSKNWTVGSELSLTNTDLNRFSDVDNGDNQGLGGHFKIQHQLNPEKTSRWNILSYGEIETVSRNFVPLNPYRNQEFNRDWNVDRDTKSRENILKMGSIFNYGSRAKIGYNLNSFTRDDYEGWRHLIDGTYLDSTYQATANLSLVSTSSSFEKTEFVRPTVEASRKIPFGESQIGLFYQAERNERRDASTDELKPTSFAFNRLNLFLKNPESSTFHYLISGNRRVDDLPFQDSLIRANSANEFVLNTQIKLSSRSNLRTNFTYRDLNVANTELTEETPRETYLGQVDLNLNILDGGIRSQTSYLIQSGQELKQEFEYVQVEQGQGNFIWVDYNMDSLRQQNEFELSQVDTADYLKITVFNNEFIRTNSLGINQSLRLEWRNILGRKRKNTWQRFVKRFSNLHSLRINQKTNIENVDRGFEPLKFDIQDSSLVSYNSFVNNTLYFNRSNPTFDAQLSQNLNNNKFVQITGFEARSLEEYTARFRWSPVSHIDLIIEGNTGVKISDSEVFDERDFSIRSLSFSPEINYRPTPSFRIKGRYSLIEKDQQINLNETLRSHDMSMEIDLRRATTSSLNSSFSFVKVNLEGATNTPVAFELLNGLQNGQNYLWRFAYTRRLNNAVDFILDYEGRKTGDSPVVHIGRAQVKASF